MRLPAFEKKITPARLALAIAIIGAWALLAPSANAAGGELRLDPAQVMGPDACGECHKSSVSAWKPSHHSTTFKDLPRSKKAKEIGKKMGIRRIKADSDCLTCHFTSAVVGEKTKPVAGISCESCHGAGKGWIKLHSDYGGKGAKKESESAEHKTKRYADSEAAGMIRPSRLYQVANNCFECHTVPNEKLVNVGGHTAGSKFDLVAWSQGEVRHNVWYSKDNNGASANRKRMMYVVGKALDLEHALRGVGKATKKANYAKAMARRAKAARVALEKMAAAVQAPELAEMIAAAKAAKLKLNNADALNAAADKVGAAARKFAEAHDGSAFAGLDAMMPGADKYKGKAVP